MMTVAEFAKHFDLAYLTPNLTEADILDACRQAKEWNVNCVNVNSCWGELVVKELAGTDVKPTAVIGFPLGAMSTKSKMFELQEMIDVGCTQCDMVVNIGKVKGGDWDYVREEIRQFVQICGDKCEQKLIFEVAFLTDDEIAKLADICCEEGITFLKTSSGTQAFPTQHQVQIMRDHLAGHTKLKVSGVPRTFTMPACLFMIENMDVSLCGTRSAAKIIKEYKDFFNL